LITVEISIMSASEQMRAMLDQLMGTARNGQQSDGNDGIKFTDPSVCKSFLTTCCPHELLASTRMDLGECPKLHDLALRADYEAAAMQKDYFYDVDSGEHLKSFIEDCDRRTELAKKRLMETQEELSAEVTSKAEKVHALAESIGKKLAQAEEAGAEGKVDESMKLLEEVEQTKKKKADAEQEYRNSMPASSYQQQKLRVCEICSAYLGIHDNDRRLADHFGGKLHLGFIKIREKLDKLLVNHEERKTARREARLKESGYGSDRASSDKPNDLERDREKRRRERDRDRERDRRDRRRTRSRSRSRERRGSSRRDRSRSRDRHRSSRSHRRSRSRERRRRSRSYSREKRRRSRSRGSREREYTNGSSKSKNDRSESPT